MAPVVGFVKGVAAAWAAFAAKNAVLAAVIKFTATIAASYAIGRVLSPKLRSSLTSGSPLELTRNPLTARRIIYGETRVGGEIRFHHETGGNNNKYLYLVIVWATHPAHAIDELWFNDELIPLDGSGNATGTYAGLVRCTHHLGAWDQAADANFVAELGSLWTSTDRLRGCAYSAIRLTFDQAKFPANLPAITVKGRWRIPYDPRDVAQSATDPATWKYTNNLGVCLHDYLRGVPIKIGDGSLARLFGLNAEDDEIVAAAAVATMNVCDEAVARATGFTRTCNVASGNRHIGAASLAGIVPGLPVSGTGIAAGTAVVSVDEVGGFFTVDRDPTATNAAVSLTLGDSERRYTANGAFDLDAAPSTVIDAFLSAMGGKLHDVGGDLVMRAGAWEEPDTEIDTTMLRRGGVTCSAPLSYREKLNTVRGVFADPAQNYARGDFPPVVSDALVAADDAELPADLDLSGFVTSPVQAQRIAKMKLLRTRQGIIATKACNLRAAVALTGENYRFSHARFGWDEKAFELLEFTLSLERDANGRSGFVVDLTGQETDASVYDWTTDEENTADPAPNTTLGDPRNVAAPTNLVLTSAGEGLLQPDGTYVPRMKAAWTAPVDQAVISGGRIELQYRVVSTSDWSDWSPLPGVQTWDRITDVLVGTIYEVRVRAINNLGVPSAWATPAAGAHTVAGDTAVPSAPASITATPQPGFIRLVWPPSASDTVNEYAIERSTTSGASGFTALADTPNSQYDDGAVTPGTTYWYRVTARSRSEIASAAVTSSGVIALQPAVGAAVPSNPTAPSSSASGTYDAGDGSVMAFHTITVAALPANAVWQNLLYRRNGASDWLIGAQLKNTSGTSVPLDDLTPGVTYQIAMQAWSAAGGSAIVAAGSNIVAPNKSAAPAQPTAFVSSGLSSSSTVAPVFVGGREYPQTLLSFTPAADLDLAFTEIKIVLSNDPDSTSYSWLPSRGGNIARIAAGEAPRVAFFDSGGTGGGSAFVFARSRNISGVATAWTLVLTSVTWSLRTTGTLADQNANDVGISSIRTGGSSGARTVRAVYHESIVANLAGGAPYEHVTVSLSGRGFSTKPDVGFGSCADPLGQLEVDYDYTHPSNSSTTAVMTVTTRSGANIGAGLRRLSVNLVEYD